jgi:uncharacterized damage-inducible protein DinB
MHRKIAEPLNYAERQREVLFEAVRLIPASLRDQRGDPDTWSVAEVLEHLHRVEKSIARLLAHLRDQAKAAGLEPESEGGSVLESLDQLQLLDRGVRLNAPEPVMPRGRLTAAQGMAALAESRQALISALRDVDGLALGRVTYAHPLMGSLNLYQWVLFVGQHEARHAAQIQDIARRVSS